jgi:Uma2 family endonuclease
VIDPQTQTVMVYRSAREVSVFALEDTLTAPDLLPGFSLPVAEIFE